jgi:hypothetical protein
MKCGISEFYQISMFIDKINLYLSQFLVDQRLIFKLKPF